MGDGFEITCTASSPVARGGKLKNVELALPACKKLALMDKGLNRCNNLLGVLVKYKTRKFYKNVHNRV